METTLFVLWLSFSAPWSFHSLPMTPGWASVAVLDAEACQSALRNLDPARPALCLPPGTGHDPQPLALLQRRFEKQEDADGVSTH